MKWNKKFNVRKLPWKGIKDPYRIWLSEIILQQTRVEQGEKYYYAFINNYPNIIDLAEANDEQVFKLWQGLGYYNRCRNMLATARIIAKNYDGIFPSNYPEILALKGIGEYTAAAISSFAFNLPYAVVDGNVVRLLSRIFMLDINFHSAKGKKEIQDFAQSLLDKNNAGEYNQAIMDLGATICKPQNPLCTICPFISNCKAHANETISSYPIKKIKKPLRERHFHFIILTNSNTFYIQKRFENDIWKDLYTFYCIENETLKPSDLPTFLEQAQLPAPIKLSQVLTHQKIHGYFYQIPINSTVPVKKLGLIKVKKSDLHLYAFPKIIASFFEKFNYL